MMTLSCTRLPPGEQLAFNPLSVAPGGILYSLLGSLLLQRAHVCFCARFYIPTTQTTFVDPNAISSPTRPHATIVISARSVRADNISLMCARTCC